MVARFLFPFILELFSFVEAELALPVALALLPDLPVLARSFLFAFDDLPPRVVPLVFPLALLLL